MALQPTTLKAQAAMRWLNALLDRIQERIGPGTFRSFLALGDQALVSGSRFAASVIIGRSCGAAELGTYGLCFTFVVLFCSAVQALVTLPYTVYWKHRAAHQQDGYAGSVLLHFFALCLVASVTLIGAAVVSSLFPGGGRLSQVLLTLSVFLPALLLWEFGRRIGFAHLRVRTVFLLDFCAAALFVTSLICLSLGGGLSAVTAYMVMGTLFGASTLLCLTQYGQVFRPERRRAVVEAVRHWRFGRWILASETLFMARGYVVPWLVALLMGPKATGIFVAYMTIVALANPLLHGIGNVLAPDLARAHVDHGVAEVRRIVYKATLALFAATFLLAVALSFGGEALVRFLYGDHFAHHAECVAILVCGFVVEAIGMPSYDALWAVERSNACFRACLGGLIATVVITVCLTPIWGLTGAACGVSFGRLAATLIQAVAFRRYVRDLTTAGATA